MLKSHLPVQHTASAKLELSKKSPLLSASENQTYPFITKTKAFRETDVWAEQLKFRALLDLAKTEEGA